MRASPRTIRRTASTGGLVVLFVVLAIGFGRLSRPVLPGWTLGAPAWWPAAGVLVAVLARGPRRWWPTVLAVAAVSSLAGDLLAGLSAGQAVLLVPPNLAEVALAALVLMGGRAGRRAEVLSFGGGVRLIAALLTGLAASAALATPHYLLADGPPWLHLRGYLLAHGLVLTAFAPLLLLPDRRTMARQLRHRARNLEWAVQFAPSAALAWLIFPTGHGASYGFVLFLPLVWGAARLGPLRAMISLLVTCALALGGTRAARGPSVTSVTAGQAQILLLLLTTLAVSVLLMLFSALAQREATERARERERSLAESQRLVQLGSWTWDLRTDSVAWSAQMFRVFGLDPRRFRPELSNWLDYVHPDERVPVQRHLLRAARFGDPWEVEFRLCRSDGQVRWIYSRGGASRDPDGTIREVRGTSQDVTEQRLAQARLRESEERFRLSFDSASVGMYIATLERARHMQITQVNAAMCEFLGRSPDEVLGRRPDAFSDDARAAEIEARQFTRDGGDLSRWRREVRFERADGSQVWGLVSCSVVRPPYEAPYVVALVGDITAGKQAEERLRHLAHHDSLTGLPNRTLLTDRIQHALAAATRSGATLGLLYCDLDGFKQVNDSAGHAAGDELLMQAAARLEAVVRPGDTVARLGGDEFAVLCPDLNGQDALQAVAARTLAALRAPFDLQAGTFTVSASIGACLSDADGVTAPTGAAADVAAAEQLLYRADAAMYGSKRSGKDRFTLSSADEHARAQHESWLRPALETALRDDELVMFGQPIVELATGAVSGVETLLRWQHPERGLLMPGEFLDVAENSPLMIPIGRRVLHESCRLAADWVRRLGPDAPDVHVNVSGRQVGSDTFAQDVLDALSRYDLAPQHLVLELTETHMPMMGESLRADIIWLRELGVRLAIDDIGTGYSSLARLTELPVDVLKIDMKFVGNLGADPGCDAVVRAVLAIGRALRFSVVAEGVETPDQERLLRQFGCELVQGFLLARPQPEAALALTLEAAASDRRDSRPAGPRALRREAAPARR